MYSHVVVIAIIIVIKSNDIRLSGTLIVKNSIGQDSAMSGIHASEFCCQVVKI
jgi:hypothetical protein